MNFLATREYLDVLREAETVIPKPIWKKLHCHYFFGGDIYRLGLHNFVEASYGRLYSEIPHVAEPQHQNKYLSERVTTIIYPNNLLEEYKTIFTMVHELGHVLDYNLNFERICKPVSWYAKTDRKEAFACAFTEWLLPGSGGLSENPLDVDDYLYFESLVKML